jgi:hypothetical protein
MEEKKIHLNRLLKLARFIGKHHLKDVLLNREKKYSCDRKGANIEHFSWALESLPILFPE